MKETFRRAGKVVAFVLIFLACAAGIVWILNQFEAGAQERDAQHAEIVALQAGLDEANDRLAEQGEPPVPVPTIEPGEDDLREPLIIQGERGFTGAQGPSGREGPRGEIGPRGPLGPRGETGATGAHGANGINGADGRGIQSMQCATGGWIITYTDGITEPDGGLCRGPQGVHGEQGPAGADSTVPGPEGPRGPQGTARPGTYACPDGEVMTGFTVAEDGAVTLACEDATPPVIETP